MTDEDDLDSSAVVYLRDLEDTREQRHKENIQILAAIGILGAYITMLSTNMSVSWILNAVIQFIGGSSFAFLMYKLLVNSPIPFVERDAIPKIDAALSALYVVLIALFAGVFITLSIARELNIEVTDIGDIAVSVMMFSFIAIMFVMLYVVGKRKAQMAENQADVLKERMPAVLGDVEEAEIVDSGKIEALIDRTKAILDDDGNPSWYSMNGMLGTGEPLRLDTGNREHLLNILDRIERKAEYGEYDVEDIELLEAIISRAEEKTRQGGRLATEPADTRA